MNLLDRLWRLTPVLLIGVLIGCEEANEIGDVLNPGENKIEVLYKELNLLVSNAFIDSVRSDIDQRILVGNFNDPVFGQIEATGYTNFDFSISTFQPRESAVNEFIIDSAYVQFVVSYYHSTDSSQSHSFELHTLTDTLLNNVYYLNDFQTPYTPEIVSEANSNVYSNELDTLRINLTDAFSTQLLEHLEENIVTRFLPDSLDENNNKIFTYTINQAALKDYFKGFSIIAGTDNRGIIGFDLSNPESKIDIFYRIKNETESQSISSFFKLTSAGGAKYFNSIVDRSSTALTIIDKANTLVDSISSGDDKIYLQSGTGVYPKINFKPYLDFIDTVDNIIINRTDLEISITDENSTFKYLAKPNDLRFFLYSGARNINVTGLLNNTIGNTLINTNISYLSPQSSPVPLTSFFDESENKYSGDITLFSQLVESADLSTNSLIVIPSDVSSMNRVIFDGNSVKMKIYYTIPK